jgi:UTP-glucose-1-phosphate uridylyltransferase
MTFDGDRLETHEIKISGELYYVIVDLKSQKNTLEILNKLNRCFPFAENELESGVQNLLGPINKKIVFDAVSAMEETNPQIIGHLMSFAQSQFDKYAIPACPEELTAPKLHQVIKDKRLEPYIWGGKGVGSQGDGTAQLLAQSKEAQEKVIEILNREFGLPALRLTIKPSVKVRKAIIPAAGFGTRLFPASKATKKELFPIIDEDGIAKPAILIIVEEAIEAGIEEIFIIVQIDDLPEFQGFFKSQISIENFNKLSKPFQDYSKKILEIGQKISFVIQPKQEGFGHAIYCAREAIGNEPFLLMLGDHIYRSTSDKSCAKQLIDAYQQHGMNILGLRITPQDQIALFGTVSGVWIEDPKTISISEFAEKPTIDYAKENLRVSGLGPNEYLTVFGQYILQPRIFDYLEEHINNNVRERGEFQLTSALERLRQEMGFLGLLIDGKRFDIGIPQAYLATLNDYSKKE